MKVNVLAKKLAELTQLMRSQISEVQGHPGTINTVRGFNDRRSGNVGLGCVYFHLAGHKKNKCWNNATQNHPHLLPRKRALKGGLLGNANGGA